jgi:hypothetical protein
LHGHSRYGPTARVTWHFCAKIAQSVAQTHLLLNLIQTKLFSAKQPTVQFRSRCKVFLFFQGCNCL